MGKKKSSSKKKQQPQRNNDGTTTEATPPISDLATILKVTEEAESAMESMEHDVALKKFERVAEALRNKSPMEEEKDGSEPDVNYRLFLARTLGRIGEARASLGNLERGKSDFLEALSILNNESQEGEESEDTMERHEIAADLLLYLAQLDSGHESLESYRKGILELESFIELFSSGQDGEGALNDDGMDEDLDAVLIEARKKHCGAYCSVAELYLTDLCFEPDAEAQCETALNRAIQTDDGTSPDALQAVANLRLSQSRGVDAAESMLQAWERMRVGCAATATLVGLGPEQEEEDNDELSQHATELQNYSEATALPSFDFRCQSARILLECSASLSTEEPPREQESNRCCEAAIQVLGSLLAENDEETELWYLVGCASMSQTPPNPEMAVFHWEKALEMLTVMVKKLKIEDPMEEGGEDECMEEQMSDIKAQMKEIKCRLKEIKK